MIPRRCLRAREAWSECFDREERLPGAHAAHLAECAACRAFTTAAAAAREALQGCPLPAANAAADRAVLAALRTIPPVDPAPLAPAGVRFDFAWVLRSGFSRTLAAGAASFAVTLVAAQLLSYASAADPERPAREVAQPTAAPTSGYLVNRIELWTGAAPDTELAPERAAPVPPQPAPRGKRPAGEGDAGDRAGSRLSIPSLG